MTYRSKFLKKYQLPDRSYSLRELSDIANIPLSILEQVEQRGRAAYFTNYASVREKGTFRKGTMAPPPKKLSPNQWGRARVFSFLMNNPLHDTDLRIQQSDPRGPQGYEIRVSTRKNKKYDVFRHGDYLLSFGDKRYPQYKDVTPLRAYASLDHLDPKRRTQYYQRHGKTNDISSAKWWSHHYLWPLG